METNVKTFENDDALAHYLAECTEAYDQGTPKIPDSEYDALEHQLRISNPQHPFFTRVGSEVRGGKVKLPYVMFGIEQVYIGELSAWLHGNGISPDDLIITDKMDGTSAELVYNEFGQFTAAYSRGNGYEGADITRHVLAIKKTPIPRRLPKDICPCAVRAEIEVSEEDFEKINALGLNDSNKEDGTFANARNFAAGQMNRESALQEFYDSAQVIAYTIMGSTMSKANQLRMLANSGFKITSYLRGSEVTNTANGMEEKLIPLLARAKETSTLALDGFVLTVDRNPALQIKFKVEDASNFASTKVVAVHWEASRHGREKPRVEVEPVKLSGVTVTFATGFNGKFIFDNKIGPGAVVELTRKGEVIPYILKVAKPADKPSMPGEEGIDWYWDGVECMLPGTTDEQIINSLKHFFTTLSVPQAGEGTAKALVEAGIDNVSDMIKITSGRWEELIGANGIKVYEGLKKVLNPVDLAKLADASGCYPAGVGERKLKAIENELGTFENLTLDAMCSVKGIEMTTAEKIAEGDEKFMAFQEDIEGYFSLKAKPTGTDLAGVVVEFTGVRRKDLEEIIVERGGKIGSAFTVLVCKDKNSSSAKVKKAKEAIAKGKDIKIYDVTEAESWLGK